MAARFWTYVFGWQIALALSLAWLWGRLTAASTALFVLQALLAWWLLLALGEGLCFALARHYGSSAAAPAQPARSAWWTVRAYRSELLSFVAAWTAMMSAPFTRRLPVALSRPAGRAASARAVAPRPVLLIHGFSCNAAVWNPLHRRLDSAQIGPVTALDLEPLGADLDSYIPSVLSALQLLERATNRAPVTLIGHSSGGLVARALLRRIEPRRIRQLITLATPHHGTELARWVAGRQATQLRPGSAWLRALNGAQDGALPVPTLCIYSLDDNIVSPAHSAALRGTQRLQLEGFGHFGVLHAPAALELIEVSLCSSLGGGH
jgi:triacylglycerol esterase/lipase EstA (alpha/beta hydrolase family)